MSRYKGRVSANAIERDFPHVVETVVPKGVIGKTLAHPGDYEFNEWEKTKVASHAKIKLDHSQIQKGPVRGFTCPITNDATPKQIAAVKLIDSKGSHVTT